MKVKELIVKLQNLNPEALVVQSFPTWEKYYKEYKHSPLERDLEPRFLAFVDRSRKSAASQKAVVLL